MLDELSTAAGISADTPYPSDPPSTWDSLVSSGDESLLLDHGFEYGFHMQTMWGWDKDGAPWVAHVKDEGGSYGAMDFFRVNSDRGTTVKHGPLYHHEFNEMFPRRLKRLIRR